MKVAVRTDHPMTVLGTMLARHRNHQRIANATKRDATNLCGHFNLLIPATRHLVGQPRRETYAIRNAKQSQAAVTAR